MPTDRRWPRAALAAALLATLTAATGRGCSETQPPPNQKATQPIELTFQARGTPQQARIFLRVGKKIHINADRRIPWKRTLRIQPTESVEFMIGIEHSDDPEIVTCAIYNGRHADGTPIEVETGHGRNPSAVCLLAPLSERLKG